MSLPVRHPFDSFFHVEALLMFRLFDNSKWIFRPVWRNAFDHARHVADVTAPDPVELQVVDTP